VNVEHRGWTLQASWFHSFCGTTEGWVCFATRPSSCHKLNIGRWGSSEIALEHGRAYVDRRVDAPAQSGAKPGIQKRRP
jgi:hypothetical protein